MIKLNTLSTSCAIIFFICVMMISSEDPDQSELKNTTSPSKKDEVGELGLRNNELAIMAQNLSSSMSDPDVRSFIKSRANEQFDGDYNFLFELTKDDQVGAKSSNRSSRSFGDLLTGNAASLNSGFRQTQNFLDSISLLHPLLQIAIPELENSNLDDWDSNSEIPLVAYVPYDYDENDPHQ